MLYRQVADVAHAMYSPAKPVDPRVRDVRARVEALRKQLRNTHVRKRYLFKYSF